MSNAEPIERALEIVEFHLLGDVHVVDDDDQEIFLSPQQRALLAVLILAPGQRADHQHITDQLWPSGGGSAAALRQCVTGLRKKLVDRVLKGGDRGFVEIRVARNEVDYFRFVDGVTSALKRPIEERLEVLRSALVEWPDEIAPLVGTGEYEVLGLRDALTKERVNAAERYLRSLEKLDSREFSDQLRRARRLWPADSGLFAIELEWRFSRRRADVHQFYQNWVREYGRPALAIEQLYIRRSRGSVLGLAELSTPRQLPAHRASLFGREAQLAELNEVLIRDDPTALRAVVVTGMPGVGKSQLVQYWADSVAASFPDGTLYIDLNGFGSREAPEEPTQLLARLLNDLGVEPSAPTFDGMVTTYRTALSGRRTLVVLDNARDERQVRPLLPGNGLCAVVTTSRDRLEMLQIQEQVHEIWLGPLGHADAVALLNGDLGTARVGHTQESLDEIAALCGGLPLTLTVVAARLRSRRRESPADVAASLRDEHTRLDTLGHRIGDLDIRSALNTSYSALPDTARRLLAQLALHPGPTIGWAAMVALCGGPALAVAGDEALTAANLLDQPALDRRTLHDLVRLFATERAQDLPPVDRSQAIDRIFGYLLHNAHSCDQVLAPDRRLPIGEPTGFDVVRPATVHEAMAWLTTEYATATAAVRRAHERGLDAHTWTLALTLVTFQWRTHRYPDSERYLGYAMQAADRSASPTVRALVRRALGGSLRGLGERPRAKSVTIEAVALAEQDGDEHGVAHGRQRLALLHREMNEPQAAAHQYMLALADFRRLGVATGEAHALAGLADVRLDLGDVGAALEFGEAAVILFTETEDENGQANTIVGLGRAYAAGNDNVRAASHFEDAASRYRKMQYRSREALTLVELAGAQQAGLAFADARASLRRANEIYLDLGDSAGADTTDARLRKLDA
ncbi:NB-ARC domain-containing protein [Micromonospora sp. NPDC005979]|uniref:AfsR/SARP family transcriptional regulator n=1 Tax=Micromonospora sp. NPDC005979 TaxID=3156726 RepID=UPI00339FB8A3